MVFFFFSQRALFFNFSKDLFFVRGFSKVYDFHFGLYQTVSLTGSFFKCFFKGCFFSHVFSIFSKVFCFCKVFYLTNVFQMLFPYFRCFFVSCSQGFFSTQRYLSSPSFGFSQGLNFSSRINFHLKGLFSFSRFFPKFFDWSFTRSLFSQGVFSQGFFSYKGLPFLFATGLCLLSSHGVVYSCCQGVVFPFFGTGCDSVEALFCPSCFSKDLFFFFFQRLFQMFIIFISDFFKGFLSKVFFVQRFFF